MQEWWLIWNGREEQTEQREEYNKFISEGESLRNLLLHNVSFYSSPSDISLLYNPGKNGNTNDRNNINVVDNYINRNDKESRSGIRETTITTVAKVIVSHQGKDRVSNKNRSKILTNHPYNTNVTYIKSCIDIIFLKKCVEFSKKYGKESQASGTDNYSKVWHEYDLEIIHGNSRFKQRSR